MLIYFNNKKIEVEIHPAENGEIALQIINSIKERLSLVITDINMPYADGNEVAKCAIENNIPVIIVSANLRALNPDIAKQCAAKFDVTANEERLMNTVDNVLKINQNFLTTQ